MERYFVNELYWSTESIFEKAEPKGKKVDELKEQSDKLHKAFIDSLSKEQEEKFEALREVEGELSIEEINSVFRQGVALGVNVVAEGMFFKEGEL